MAERTLVEAVRAAAAAEHVAMMAAYEALRPLDLDRWGADRVLGWIKSRLASDRATAKAATAPPGVMPDIWSPHGEHEPYTRLGDAAEAHAEPGKVLELDGYAVVSRQFCVAVPTEDGPEFEWYDTREEAEAAQARINAWGNAPADGGGDADG